MEAPVWTPAFIGLGSNLGHPEERLAAAVRALDAASDTRVMAGSGVYRSAPVGPRDQPDFLNAVVAVLTRLDADSLLTRCLDIERGEGRDRSREQRWGPRRLDLDILVFGQASLDCDGLHVPHRELARRAFALVPLAEVAPWLPVPGLGQPRKLLAALGDSELTRVMALQREAAHV